MSLHDPQRLFDPARVEPWLRLRDNPILLAQLRAQLRQKRALGTLQIVALLSLLILLVAYSLASPERAEVWSGAMHAISWLMFVFMYWRGAGDLMDSVSSERESGIFIFLRSSPMSSLSVAFGYLVGGASRGYIASAGLALPWFITGSLAGHSFGALLVAYVALLLGALTLHSFVLLFALKGQGKMKMTLKIGFFVLYFVSDLLSSIGLHSPAHLTPIPSFSALGLRLWGESVSGGGVALFSLQLSHYSYSLIVQGLALCACLWVASRKIERESQPSVSRRGGMLMWLVGTLLVMGVDLNPSALNQLQSVNVSLGFLPGGVALSVISLLICASLLFASSPKLISFQRSSARQSRRDKSPASTSLPWADEGASLLTFCLILILCLTVQVCVYFVLHGGYEALKVALNSGLSAVLLSTAVALLALSGLSEHASALARQQSYSLTLWVRLLTIFLLPLILALIATQLGQPELIEPLTSLSPLYALLYAFKSFLSLAPVPSEASFFSFAWTYFALSLGVGLGVSAWSFSGALKIKRALLTQLR